MGTELTKAALRITEWREYGDDEDQLDMRLVSNPEIEVQVFHAIAEENDLEFTDSDKPLADGALQIINTLTISDGDLFADESGTRFYRVRIEEVKNNA